MRSIAKLSTVLIAFYILLYSCNSKTENGDKIDQEYINQLTVSLDSIGHEIINYGQIMGLSIAVAKKGEVIYENGFGYIDSTKTQKVMPDNIFLLASISKLVGATMTMKLVEEKKLSLNNTLAELLPDFPNSDQASKITLKQLLDHTSGLKDYASVIDSVYIQTNVDPKVVDYYDFFESHSLDFEPSTHFNYSNSGYVLMAEIIEQVTGNSFEDELDRIINNPSGLNLKLVKDNEINPKLTSIFELKDSTFVYKSHWPWIKGDGGLTTTASELAQYAFHWSNGKIVSEESFNLMCIPSSVTGNISTGYGLGVRTGIFEGEQVVGHTGGNKTALAVLQYFPEKETSIVVFVNTDNTNTDALYIIGHVALAVLEKEEPILEQIEIKNEDLSRFLGDYVATNSFYYGSGKLSIVKYENDLNLYRKRTNSESKGQKLYYLGNNEFSYDPYPMDRVVFQVDSIGDIVAFNNFWNGLKNGGLYRKQK